MALFRCNQCAHIREVSNDYIGKSVKCPKCKKVNKIHDTIVFIENIVKKYLLQNKEITALRKSDKKEKKQSTQYSSDYIDLKDINNTKDLSRQEQYKPIENWFENKDIKINIDHDALDTTGFFDEIALSLGNNYSVLKDLCSQIKYIQNKGYATVKFPLTKKNKKEKTIIKNFCKELYDYSFVARYSLQQKDQTIFLALQESRKIVNFFNGLWFEWFVFMKLLEFFKKNKIPNSTLRSFTIHYNDDDKNELDIFFIANDIPVCIECKSGEFRHDIHKYSQLKKRFKLEETQFLLCVLGLEEKITQGLSCTHDLTFVNETNFLTHLESILLKRA